MPDLPAEWSAPADWEARANRIAEHLRARDPAIRGVVVLDDYATADLWPASVLRLLPFRHDPTPRVDFGVLEAREGLAVTADTCSTGVLTDLEGLLMEEPMAASLAACRPLRLADPVLRDVLAAFRDNYFTAEARAARVARMLRQARVRLSAARTEDEPWQAAQAFAEGWGPAVCALVSEPADGLRLVGRFRSGARVRRLPNAADLLAGGLGLDERDPAQQWEALESLARLARSHVAARAPHLGELADGFRRRALEPARHAIAILGGRGDSRGAAWAPIQAGLQLTALVGGIATGLSERDDFRALAPDLYGAPAFDALEELDKLLRPLAGSG